MNTDPPPIRVLIAIGSMNVGGTEGQILEVCRSLGGGRFQFDVVTTEDEGQLLEALERTGARVHSLGFRRRHVAEGRVEQALRLVRSVPRFRALLRQIRPQVIHAYLVEMSLVSAAARWPRRTPPLVISKRSLVRWIARDPVYFWLARWFNRQADLLLANSEAVRLDVMRMDGVEGERVEVIYNGVDTSVYAPGPPDEDLRRELGLPAGLPVVGIVANLNTYKGHGEVVEAAAALRVEGKRLALLFVGRDGNAAEALRQQVERLKLENVVFAGPRGDVPRMLRLMDVFVSASHEEGFSNSILEAMSAGRAIVTTSVGGSVEQIANGATGLVVPPRSPVALAAAVGRLLGDPALREQLGSAAREEAIARFGMERVFEETAALYERLLASRSAGSGEPGHSAGASGA
jgi:glycosyltransferase involved in cell wall biosynthesis